MNPTLLIAIPLLPLIAAVIAGLGGRHIVRAGAHTVTIAAVALSCGLSLAVLKRVYFDGAPLYVLDGEHLRAAQPNYTVFNGTHNGMVKTPLWGGMAETDREALYQQTAERLPVGHVGEPAEIAEAYLYLMGQSYATGQVLVVDGGALLT